MADRSSHGNEINLPSGASPLSRKHSENNRKTPVEFSKKDMREMLRAFPRKTK
jgi:hypothetical protein